MDIFISKKMRNFILLAQTNNIARAAEKIHMTASPFGKSIAALEEQIGYTLFTRKDNNISLNKAGQELYQNCSRFINGFLRLIMKSITQGVVHEKL